MSARDYALLELDRKRLPGWPAGTLKRIHPQPPEDPRDRALAEQIVAGVTKNLLHLRHLIGHYSGRLPRNVDPLVQKILATGLYQLRFLTRIPASAAVNEAVEQAKRFRRSSAAGFVNAVLRKTLREPAPALPDPAVDPAGYAELALSHPRELFARLSRIMGPADALRFCEHDNAEPPTIVRLLGNATEADLHSPGIEVRPHERSGLFIIEGARLATLADWAQHGIAQAQDPTAAAVVAELDIRPGQRVLDRCCGLGTKTLQMGELLGGDGLVVGIDPSEQRCRVLRDLLVRRGIGNIRVHQIGMLEQLPPDEPRALDRILIDVPCSNSGVLARRPEARYAQGDDILASLAKLQDRILDDTAGWLAPGGRLVYSTCSVWPSENQTRVAQFLSRHPEYRLLRERAVLPSLDPDSVRYHDGGYLAVLERH